MAYPETHQNHPNIFVGGLDFDSDNTLVEQTDYRYALNIRNGVGAIEGAVVNVGSNIEVTTSLPAGINTCIGVYEDKRNAKLVYFIQNSIGQHSILQYDPNNISPANPNGVIELIAQGGVFNFNANWLITHSQLINGELLYWTDAASNKNDIIGNPPRKINIAKSNINGKFLAYELIAGLPNQGQFADAIAQNTTVQIIVRNRATNAVLAQQNIVSGILAIYANNPEGFLNFVNNLIVTTTLSAHIDSEFCECKLELTAKSINTYLTISETNAAIPDFFFVRANHYPSPLREQHIDLIKYPPKYEPAAKYVFDPSIEYNNVNRAMFQFSVRYWYDDDEKSAWSPFSIIPINIDQQGTLLTTFNAVDIDFTTSRLNNPESLAIIKRVELAFREGNTGVLKSIKIIDTCKIGINEQVYRFKNDQLFSIVESDDANNSGSTQVLKLFDSVPVLTGCLDAVADNKGNTRLFCAANLENYDPLDCVDMIFDVSDEEQDDCLVTITGTVNLFNVDIINNLITASPQNKVDFPSDYYSINGFIVYLAGTNFYAVSDNPINGGNGKFTINGVPKGKYLLRVASYKCRFNDDKSSIHNLNNGLAWQRTSSPIIDIAGSFSATGVRTERLIDLTGFVGGVFDLDTQIGFGDIKIANIYAVIPNIVGTFRPIYAQTYFYDNNGSMDLDQNLQYSVRQGAINVERQKIHCWFNNSSNNLPLIDNLCPYSDHNGYSWVIGSSGWFSDIKIQVYNNLFLTQINNVSPLNQILCFTGGIEKIYTNTIGTTTSANSILPLPPPPNFGAALPSYGLELVFYNVNEAFTKNNKTKIQGVIQDGSNNGLPNVLVLYERNTRPQVTTNSGFYDITIYTPYTSNRRNDDNLLVTYKSDICYDYPLTPTNGILLLDIGLFGVDYDYDTYFVPPVVKSGTLIGGLLQINRYLKRGGVYRMGIVYEDRGNRAATVSETIDTLKIPFFTIINKYSRPTVRWEIRHTPPVWATHYRIVRTKETLYRRYLHTPAARVRYVRIDKASSAPQDTSYSNGDATHILISVGQYLDSATNQNFIQFFYKTQNNVGYEAQVRDRVRFILDESSKIVVQNTIWEVEVVGTFLEADEYFVCIENPNYPKEIKASWLIELYSPKRNEEFVFYECGESYEITGAGTANPYHAGPLQNQNASQPAVGVLVGGDTYWRVNDFAVNPDTIILFPTEHPNMSWQFDSINEDIGRATVADKDFRQQFYEQRIRFSGLFLPETQINALSAFKAIDFSGIDQRYGIIKRLILAREVLLAVCEFKIQPVYVGKDTLMDLSGRANVGRSDAILNIGDQLKYDIGTQHPESIVEENGSVYGVDIYKGVAWRYSYNGLFPISTYKANTFFNELGQKLQPIKGTYQIQGGFDRIFQQYMLSVSPNKAYLEGLTIGFDEPKNRWASFYSFIPQQFGRVGNRLVCFKQGRLWQHDYNSSQKNNFFGQQYGSIIKFVCNFAPKGVKIFQNIELQADKLWFAPEISIPANTPYAAGMLSRLKVGRWVNVQGVWQTDFLRDMNDTKSEFLTITNIPTRQATALLRGRVLRGEFLIVTLELAESTQPCILRRVDIEATFSMDTKT
jgi:hypothetical protein